MNLVYEIWNEKTYKIFLKWLKEKQEISYLEFQKKIILEDIPMIGIRSEQLKKIAKEISKGSYITFIKQNNHYYYEEIMIHGFILGNLKTDFATLLKLIEDFLPYNQSWAINDSICSCLKQFKKNQEIGYQWILKILDSNHPWNIRFALILLLDYYINDIYIDKVLVLATKQYPDYYYVNMAIAWLLSVCYIKYPEKTEPILKKNILPSWIQRKTISKIRDSYRVSREKKDYLKTLIK